MINYKYDIVEIHKANNVIIPKFDIIFINKNHKLMDSTKINTPL